MGDMAVYGYDVQYPLVNHPHQRSHQHRPLLHYLSNKQTDPKLYPNYPDIDMRDGYTEYLIEVELPGVRDASEINCRWTSLTSLVVSGNIQRPAAKTTKPALPELGTRDAHGEYKPPKSHEPFILIGERKIGTFERHFTFPLDVDMDKLEAKLEAGLLQIRVPKMGHKLPTGSGIVKIQS